jgi:hypothetical protein
VVTVVRPQIVSGVSCGSCLFPDQMTRAIALYEFVAVPAETAPAWRIFADLGG